MKFDNDRPPPLRNSSLASDDLPRVEVRRDTFLYDQKRAAYAAPPPLPS